MITPVVKEHFANPRNLGVVDSPEGTGRAGSLTCGASLLITLRIDEQHRILDSRFKAAGCSRLVAACSLITELARNKTTAEAATLAQTAHTALEFGERCLGEAEEGREHCVSLAGEALLTALRNYSDAVRAEWTGDDALICSCFGVSEKTIENTIRKGTLQTVAEVTTTCNAGAGCRSCHTLIQDILDELSRRN